MKNITFRESVVFGIALGASMLFLIAATPIKNLVFQGNADAAGYQITNLATGTNASNASTKGYVDAATETVSTNLAAHTISTNNPHAVTASQVGLGSVEDTAISSWAGSGNLTRTGTITNGTWSGNVISVSKGGTGSANGLYSTNIFDSTAAGRELITVVITGPLNCDQAFIYNYQSLDVLAVDTTGTGKVVRSTSPALVTPSLGNATASSINKLAITAPSTNATLTIANGKTLTANNSLSLTGTDGSTLNVGTGGTLGSAAYTAATVYEPKGAYAVIHIPLPAGSQWTDFELKASTNNFTNDTTGMVFWYHSPDPTKLIITGQRWTVRPDVYFTDSGKTGTPNQRGWIKQNDTQSIFAMLTDANSEVGGFLIVIKDDLSAHRDHLVFSYSLLDASTGDKDPANRGVWRPVWPQEWVNSFDITNSSP